MIPYLKPGTLVKALDRGNYGYVEEDRGETVHAVFTSEEGSVAHVPLRRDQIEVPSQANKGLAKPNRGSLSGAPPLTTATRSDAWTLGRVLAGEPLNGELDAMSELFRRVALYLSGLALESRQTAWNGFLCGRPDESQIIQTMANVDPLGPAPGIDVDPPIQFATLKDLARIVSTQPWLWPGWIASGVLNAVASEPGTGKTRFALDIARRLYFKLPWPDGQANVWPAGTRTLWVQGDRAWNEMMQAAQDFGIPFDAVALSSSPEEPTGSLDLDDPDTLEALGKRIQAASPALVLIDTVGMVTGRNLSRPEEARAFFAPIIELGAETGVAFLALTHLSKDKDPLGRRIVEKARVVMKMTCPDPDGQPNRRRLWVDKTAIQKPPPLGITIGDDGNEYDPNPPSDPEVTRKPGPIPAKLEECKLWLRERLSTGPARVSDVRRDAQSIEFSAKTLYRAHDELKVTEYPEGGRKWWRLHEGSDVREVRDD